MGSGLIRKKLPVTPSGPMIPDDRHCTVAYRALVPNRRHMPNDPVDTRSGARTTRLGLVAFGFAIGVIVTLVIVFAIKMT